MVATRQRVSVQQPPGAGADPPPEQQTAWAAVSGAVGLAAAVVLEQGDPLRGISEVDVAWDAPE